MDKQRLSDMQYRNFLKQEDKGISIFETFLGVLVLWFIAILFFSL